MSDTRSSATVSLSRRLIGGLIQVAFGPVAQCARIVPGRVIDGLMEVLAGAHNLCRIPYLRPRIARNMRAILGESFHREWVGRNTRALYRCVGSLLRLPAMTSAQVAAELGTLRHREILDKLRSSGKGCVLIGLHFGNHRFLAPGLAAMGYPVASLIARFPQQPSLFGVGASARAKRFRQAYARAAAVQYLAAGVGDKESDTTTHIVDTVRQGRFLHLLADGCVGHRRVEVRFLNERIVLPYSGAMIAARAGVPLIPILSSRDTCEVVIGDPMRPAGSAEPAETLQAVMHFFEPFVRERPWEWWTWFHIGATDAPAPDRVWRLLSGAEAFAVA